MMLWTICSILAGFILASVQAISSCPKHTRGCSAHLQCRFGELEAVMQKIADNTSVDPSSGSSDQTEYIVALTSNLSNLRKTVSHVVYSTGKINEEMEHLSNLLEEDIERRERVRALPSSNSNYVFCPIPRSCQEIRWKARAQRKPVGSGVFKIKPSSNSEEFDVLCDMYTEGGGWVVIQNRFGGNEDFNRGWQDYKRGFGNPSGEFWLGLDHIHAITGVEPNELLINLEDLHGNSAAFRSHQFSVGSEEEGFAIRLLDKNVGNSLATLTAIEFSTSDKDDGLGCVKTSGGGWWFNNNCTGSNLNGKYSKGGDKNTGLFWEDFRGMDNRLKITSMKVRAKLPSSL